MTIRIPLRDTQKTVLITGVSGGGVGLEIFKALRLANRYRLLGVDASPLSMGLYMEEFERTFMVPRADNSSYLSTMLSLCKKERVSALAPGSEAELMVLADNKKTFDETGIMLMINDPKVIRICSDKAKQTKYLQENGIPVPKTEIISREEDVTEFGVYPSVVKPSTSSGGSRFAFLAEDEEEAKFFVKYLMRRSISPLMQEYIGEQEGEYTVGVLSTPHGDIIGSIALKRLLHNRLSYMIRYGERVLSTGVSQGIIDNFSLVQEQSERIARILGSKWSLNVQGRLVGDVFYVFEINPRHSGTTYLRALAGFNEPDILLQSVFGDRLLKPERLNKGYYLRGLTELYIPFEKVKKSGGMAEG
ncbi:MAG: ATP-grasp domain-containing protein [Candidatus Atabeyarchaeum deiterrae]